MISETLEIQITEAFNLQALRAGWHRKKTDDGQTEDRFLITSIWLSEIIAFYECKIVVCVIHSNKWGKGLLVTTDTTPYLAPPASPNVHPAIEMENWTDPVLDTASMINLFPKFEWVSFSTVSYDFDFHAYTYELSVNLNARGLLRDDPSIRDLWRAIQATVYDLTKRYNDPEISSCIVERYR